MVGTGRRLATGAASGGRSAFPGQQRRGCQNSVICGVTGPDRGPVLPQLFSPVVAAAGVEGKQCVQAQTRPDERRPVARPVAVQRDALGRGCNDVAAAKPIEQGIAASPDVCSADALDAAMPAPVGQRMMLLAGMPDNEPVAD